MKYNVFTVNKPFFDDVFEFCVLMHSQLTLKINFPKEYNFWFQYINTEKCLSLLTGRIVHRAASQKTIALVYLFQQYFYCYEIEKKERMSKAQSVIRKSRSFKVCIVDSGYYVAAKTLFLSLTVDLGINLRKNVINK